MSTLTCRGDRHTDLERLFADVGERFGEEAEKALRGVASEVGASKPGDLIGPLLRRDPQMASAVDEMSRESCGASLDDVVSDLPRDEGRVEYTCPDCGAEHSYTPA